MIYLYSKHETVQCCYVMLVVPNAVYYLLPWDFSTELGSDLIFKFSTLRSAYMFCLDGGLSLLYLQRLIRIPLQLQSCNNVNDTIFSN